MSEHNFPKPIFRRETRLGLVVYGGVSLAVYMNGVCREFYNAVRGRGVYKLIKALTDSDIVVDILSGTSAGGINGVLLSYALSNSSENEVVDFANFGNIWRESGNISKLLYQPISEGETSKRESILDGAGYYQDELANAFKEGYLNKTSASKDEWFSPFNELDLFVTGTDVLGKVSTILDDTGKLIEVNNHRSIFHLKHRQNRKEPFNPEFNQEENDQPENTYQALAKLCRITSCFPVAFPVVTVNLEKSASTAKCDEKLVLWGNLLNRQLPQKKPEHGYCLHFVDGGVLDNRPFSYTIKEMYYRVSSRPTERKLFYIDPQPDMLLGSRQFNEMPKPNVLQVIQDSLVGMPSYESISQDLELISYHNQQVSRYNDLFAQVDDTQSQGSEPPSTLKIQEKVYLRTRLIRLRDRILPLVLRIGQNDSNLSSNYKQSVLTKFAELLSRKSQKNESELLFKASEQIRNLDVDYSLRKHQYIIKKIHQRMEDAEDYQEYNQLQQLVKNLNRQIKLLEVTNSSIQQFLNTAIVSNYFYNLATSDTTSATANLQEFNYNLTSKVYDTLTKLHRFVLDIEILQSEKLEKDELEKNDSSVEISNTFFVNLPSLAKKNTLTTTKDVADEKWLPQETLSKLLEKITQRIADFNKNNLDLSQEIIDNPKFADNAEENNSSKFTSILCQIEAASENLINNCESSSATVILEKFRGFRELDQVLYSFEYITEVGPKELIQTIRISPEDAALGFSKRFEPGQRLDGKLAGDSLRAFGGFFKKSWRSNDILWGRLDGLNRLVEGVVTTESVKNFPQFIRRQAKANGISQVGKEFDDFQVEYINFLLKESLPNLDTKDVEKIKEYLFKLATPGYEISTEELNNILNEIVLAGQQTILNQDLPTVIKDEIDEQFEWNQQKLLPSNNVKTTANLTPQYYPATGYFSKMVNSLAAAELAQQAIQSLPGSTDDFFRTRYQVGSETLTQNIPSLILLNLATRAGLVIRDVIISEAGVEGGKKIQQRLIYKILNKSLQIFYWWIRLQESQILQVSSIKNKAPIVAIVQLILLVIALSSLLVIVLQSPVLLVVIVVALLVFFMLENISDKL